MRMKERALFVVFFGVLLFGCAPDVTSHVYAKTSRSFSNLLIIEDLGPNTSKATSDAFRRTIVQLIQDCGIKLTVHDVDPLSLENGGDNQQIAMSLIDRIGPEAVLLIEPVNTTLGSSFTRSMFNARLVEVATRHTVWRGSFVLESGILSFYSGGSDVAAVLLKEMTTAGALKSCPSTK